MAVKNQIGDLNNHLFAQLERLSDEKISNEDLKKEINRSKAISSISKDIVSAGNLVFKVAKEAATGELFGKPIPRQLQDGTEVKASDKKE